LMVDVVLRDGDGDDFRRDGWRGETDEWLLGDRTRGSFGEGLEALRVDVALQQDGGGDDFRQDGRRGETDEWLGDRTGGSFGEGLEALMVNVVLRDDAGDDDNFGACQYVRQRNRREIVLVEGLLSFNSLSLALSNFSSSKQEHPVHFINVLVIPIASSLLRLCRQVIRFVVVNFVVVACRAATVFLRPFLLIRGGMNGAKSTAGTKGVGGLVCCLGVDMMEQQELEWAWSWLMFFVVVLVVHHFRHDMSKEIQKTGRWQDDE
jgi:hypothetical protein